ncbi:MAG: lipoprotein-releasing ABC transporter permease subunit [Gammaproteobacteria bacterium]|nr:lipoprotein-releasing ABC transporter permease subunit [Gammaproteobacteria bacterium]
MFRPVELCIGLRYIHARRGNHFIGFISLTAIVATALGVAVLLTILSIMNGFEGELRGRILGMTAHLELDTRGADWPALAERVAREPAVVALSPYVSRDVLVASRGVVRAVEVRGVVPAGEAAVTTVAEHMLAGDLDALVAGRFGVVVGRELAEALGVTVGDEIMLLSPQPISTPAGLVPRLKRFTVSGIFEFGLQEHDGGLVLVNIDDAARLFRLGTAVDGLRVRLSDAALAPALKPRLAAATGVTVRDWTDTHRNLFRALKTEKIAMFVILALAIAIAAFNLVSILVVAVTEKRGDLAMLGALGMTPAAITRVFLFQGGITGIVGVLGGLALGYLLAANIDGLVAAVENAFGFKIFSPEVYYISSIPSEPRLGDFLATAGFAAVLALGAPLYPAWLAARLPTVEGLHHE